MGAFEEFEKEILGDQLTEPETVVEPETEPETVEDTEVEESDAPVEEQAIDDAETAEEEPAETQEIELPNTINELAEAIGVPVEKLYGLEMGLPGGGKLTVGQYKDNAEKYGNIDETLKQLDTQREELAQQKAQIDQYQQQAMTMPDELLQAQAQVQQIQATFNQNQERWAELAKTVEGQGQVSYEQGNLRAAFEQAKANVDVVRTQVTQRQQQERNVAYSTYAERLSSVFPDWSDQKNVELTQFMIGEGIPAHVIEQIPYTESGEVIVKLMDELQKLRSEKSEANATAKKVSTIPINLKTGTITKQKPAKQKKLDAIINQAKGKNLTRQQLEAAERAVFERYE